MAASPRRISREIPEQHPRRMKNRIELRAYIRYQLAQLGARNGEHEFENLSFELARLRHVSNLQPATGPVKAGGDQGRDFESYRTYLASTALGAKVGWFTGDEMPKSVSTMLALSRCYSELGLHINAVSQATRAGRPCGLPPDHVDKPTPTTPYTSVPDSSAHQALQPVAGARVRRTSAHG
jgi:hypothetical protein